MTNSLTDAFSGGNKRDMLVAISQKLAKQIDECGSDRDLPALTKRFLEVQNELEQLPDPKQKKESAHDRLKAKHEIR